MIELQPRLSNGLGKLRIINWWNGFGKQETKISNQCSNFVRSENQLLPFDLETESAIYVTHPKCLLGVENIPIGLVQTSAFNVNSHHILYRA